MDYTKCRFISIEQQKVMFLCYMLENKEIDYKSQQVYHSEKAFRYAMNKLVKQNLMDQKIGKEYYDRYKLNFNGGFYVKQIILG